MGRRRVYAYQYVSVGFKKVVIRGDGSLRSCIEGLLRYGK